nr:hypothetical protein [Treponema denticola]
MKTSKQWSEKRKTVLGITLTFPSMEDKQRAVEFLNSGGRKQASYMLYLLDKEMERAGLKKMVVGKPVDSYGL